ncbi:MAG: hypothetical protein PHU85_19430 [Phycisphaerae bacterium]|nr:hypothetical protein [Phycisphaerae bacterium]
MPATKQPSQAWHPTHQSERDGPLAPVTLLADSPTTQGGDEPKLGTISGRLAPADKVKSIRCFDRAANMTYPVRWDAAAGAFSVADLVPEKRYDLEVTAADGRRFIGVDLSYEEDALIRLAREQIGETEPPAAITDDDRRQINDIVTKIDMFENERRIVHLRGDHSRAAALVELRLTTPFYKDKGEQTRRIEVWCFKFQHGGWEKLANAERVLSRVRAGRAEIEKQIASQVYLPELGGILVDTSNLSPKLDVTLPGFPPAASRANE